MNNDFIVVNYKYYDLSNNLITEVNNGFISHKVRGTLRRSLQAYDPTVP